MHACVCALSHSSNHVRTPNSGSLALSDLDPWGKIGKVMHSLPMYFEVNTLSGSVILDLRNDNISISPWHCTALVTSLIRHRCHLGLSSVSPEADMEVFAVGCLGAGGRPSFVFVLCIVR